MADLTNKDNNKDELPSPGTITKLDGLKKRSDLNGQCVAIHRYVEDVGRYEVFPLKGSGSLAVLASNLLSTNTTSPKDPSFSSQRKYQHAIFWPRKVAGAIAVHALEDWPVDEDDEIPFLKQTLQWENPKVLSGITSEGNAKPNFVMYFDAGDDHSSVNETAHAIADLLPWYELNKLGSSGKNNKKPVFRGGCVLIYSPMKSTIYTGGMGMGNFGPQSVMSGNANRRFSLHQLREVLEFHHTTRAKEMYAAHNDPKHRMFGDMTMSGGGPPPHFFA